MKNRFSQTEFTFHSSWIAAMSHIRSNAVRNRLMASIIEYGLKRTYSPIGNAAADAIMVLVMDQIDREQGGSGEGLSSDADDNTSRSEGGTSHDGLQPVHDEGIQVFSDHTITEEISPDEATTCDGDAPLCTVGINTVTKQKSRPRSKSKFRKNKRQARRRKYRR